MKKRVISSLVGLVILGLVLCIIDTFVFNLVMAAIILIGLYEMLRATDCLKNKGLAVLSFTLAVLIPFSRLQFVKYWTAQLICLFFVLFFVLLIRNSITVRVEQAAMAFMFSVFIPLFFSCAIFLRDIYGPVRGAFYLLAALGSAWFCDTGAYFTGKRFGKHKLAPVVSPKKTVEGAIGGALTATACMMLLALGFQAFTGFMGITVSINYIALALITPVWAAMGMLGDLSASVVKRQYNVKDYGRIMPGHGGIMDRFDSALFTLPAVFILVRHIAVITVLS